LGNISLVSSLWPNEGKLFNGGIKNEPADEADDVEESVDKADGDDMADEEP
jgi:hypothetical protein